MLIGCCLLAFAVSVWLITSAPARPHRGPLGSSAARELARSQRLQRARLGAGRATPHDLDLMLTANLSRTAAERALAQAASRRLDPHLLWRWADRFGVERLVLVLDAEVGARSMARHLDAGNVPDWTAMALFARLAMETGPGAMPTQEVVDLDVTSGSGELVYAPDLDDWSVSDGSDPVDPAEFAGFGPLPPIAGPARMSSATTVGEYVGPDDRLPGPPRHEPPEEDPPSEGRSWPLAS